MSTTHAHKRRKLDDADEPLQHDPQQSSPAISKHTLAATYGRQSQFSPANAGRPISGAEKWQQARTQSRTYALRDEEEKARMDVYDDIEGANAGQYPYGRLDGGKRKSANGVRQTATPQKKTKMLDPLVNQKSQESTPPKRADAAKESIFKQFSKHRKAQTVEANVVKTNGHRATETHTDESETEEQEAKVPGTSSMRGYVYAKPKKTFEDEIRELEEQARQGAAKEDSEDELASSSETPRQSARKIPQRRASARPQSERKEASSARKATTKPLDRRKAKEPSVPEYEEQDVLQEMEIDESEDEQMDDIEEHIEEPAVAVVEDTAVSTPKKATSRLSKSSTAKGAAAFESAQLPLILSILLEKTTGKRSIPLTNLSDEYAKVYSIINQTITAGESNSMLLIGARGSGKTALINQILREQTSKHGEDFHAIRLNGFIHTDDKIALREIWRQLGREMELEDDEAASKNYADTMSKLLALLSHPTEMGMDQQTDQITKSVIFILDEFELFAGHPRQTLLYNLFDIAQSRKAPIAVLGLTTRIDVAESLEKRVKSRFSHRYVHLSLSKSVTAFEQVCRKSLELTTAELKEEEKQNLGKTMKIQEAPNGSKTDVPVALVKWNDIVDQVLASDAVSAFLRRLYYTTKSVPKFLSAITLAIATIPITPETTNAELVENMTKNLTQNSMQAPDSKLSLLPTLSSLELSLLICAARLTNIYNTEIISFALVYEEYKVLASKAKLQASASGSLAQGSRVWTKDVARGAWEELMECGLVMKMGATGRVDVGLEEIGGSGVDLGGWARWCREI